MAFAIEPPPPYPDGYRRLSVGDPAPWFTQASTGGPRFLLDAAAGRTLVLCFLVSAGDQRGARALSFVTTHRPLFDDARLAFLGVTTDWRDQQETRVAESLPGVHFIWDFDLSVSRAYGAVPVHAGPGLIAARRMWVVLDPTLRVRAIVRFEKDGSDHAAMEELLRRISQDERSATRTAGPPILLLPNVFEAELCETLVRLFDAHGGEATGSLVEIAGRTLAVHDPAHKVRADYCVTDPAMVEKTAARMRRRLVPEIAKAYQFQASRMERYLVGCYRAEDGGHFASHRDNTTTATAHRRFAVSINLNEDYDGGEISFPEYGDQSYKPPLGGAVVFSCSLLHSVSRVTRARRYAFLPFLHDDAAEKIRRSNHST